MGPTCVVDRKKIRCYCNCSSNGSITGKILTPILMRLDELGIVEQGIEKNGYPFYPAFIIDGHISRLSLPFLEYINKQACHWQGMLVCSYGMSKCQFHDHEIQNASFKCKLVVVKWKHVQMHCRAGFSADLCVEEIPIIVKEASDAMYANVDFAIETFCIMGYVTFTRAVLDDADILSLASQEVQQDCGKILQLSVKCQGLSANSKITRVAPNQIDLTCTGSGCLIGGPDAQSLNVASVATLNTNGTAGDKLQLLHQSKIMRDARFQANGVRSVTRKSKLEQYEKAKKLSAGVVFHSGNGELDANVYNEVIRRMEYRSDNAAKIKEKKKKKMVELNHAVDAIMAKKITLKDLVMSQLKTMCKWKKLPGDATLPTTNKALKQLYKKIIPHLMLILTTPVLKRRQVMLLMLI